MFRLVAAAVVVAGCSKGKLHGPAGVKAVASCDYTSKTIGTNHSCTEIYDAARIPAHEAFCTKLRGPRDNGVFTRGRGCPEDGRQKGCLAGDGSITWTYEGEHSCFGKEFTGDAPAHGVAQPYSCNQGESCLEQHSVYDLATTVEKPNCETMHGTFAAGPCPTDKALGRCDLADAEMATYRIFYPPVTPDQAVVVCQTQYEGTFHSQVTP